MANPEPAEPVSPGKCVVCGKETFDRCSKCARGGVLWMCFCSREHQKLLWSIHKRVCGRRFQWPALESKEVEEMVKLSAESVDLGQGITTWMKLWTAQNLGSGRIRLPGRSNHTTIFERYLKSLGEDAEDSARKQKMLHHNRCAAFSIKRKIGKLGEDSNVSSYCDLRALLTSDPFGYLAHSQDGLVELLDGCQDATWLSDFQHRMIILVATFTYVHHATQDAIDGEAQFKQVGKFMIYAMTEVEKLAGEVIRVSHPQDANSILEDYLPYVMSSVGLLVRKDDQSLDQNDA